MEDGSPPGDDSRQARRLGPAERREQRARVGDPAVVLAAALRLLEARARSEDEVRRRLSTAGYRAQLVDGAVRRLVELGVLDDAAFARGWVESRDRSRPRSTRLLRVELVRKGIDPALAAEVLAERSATDHLRATAAGITERAGSAAGEGGGADERAAVRLLERHAAALSRVADPPRRRQRAYALLARHGFDPELISRLVESASRDWDVHGTATNDEAASDAPHREPEAADRPRRVQRSRLRGGRW